MTEQDAYWSIDIPGLSEKQAGMLLEYASAQFGLRGSAVDPSIWLTRHLDVGTVEAVVRRLSSEELDSEEESTVQGVRDDYSEWLDAAESAGPT
ncbi:hypothetical protein [Nocardioides limicola]|uniref:hypothetical protein n=1 Tax=Nocardioides limicola TaxID=2803368 RepID=UPI00193B7C26|nr:hypothetical protein [Nocardioides sp. DJM-14]